MCVKCACFCDWIKCSSVSSWIIIIYTNHENFLICNLTLLSLSYLSLPLSFSSLGFSIAYSLLFIFFMYVLCYPYCSAQFSPSSSLMCGSLHFSFLSLSELEKIMMCRTWWLWLCWLIDDQDIILCIRIEENGYVFVYLNMKHDLLFTTFPLHFIHRSKLFFPVCKQLIFFVVTHFIFKLQFFAFC